MTPAARSQRLGTARHRFAAAWMSVLFAFASLAAPAAGQAPLSSIDAQTTVRSISFKFAGGRTFDDAALREQMWHKAPGRWDRIKGMLPLLTPSTYPFSPIELQKDVVRLENYYRRNGFLHPSVDYPASQVDTARNQIRIIFTVREGPPLVLQDVGFFDGDGDYAAGVFSDDLREDWIAFRDGLALQTGRRYTQFEGIRIQDQILSWLKNAGFAFASVQRQADVDSSANTVDLRFVVNPGPRGYISEIQIDGVESVEPRIVRRELPFRVGDRYSAADVARGQQELFEMNLFRVVISELPEQPEDSTVVVRYRLREARPRNVSAQTGYGLDEGGQVEARWSHRNFMGAARQLTASGVYSSGYGAAPAGGFGASRRKSVSLRLNQPYLFTRRLSGAIAPSYVRGEVPSLNLRYEEAELNTAVIYSIYNFRTITFSHSLSRARPLGDREDLRIPTLTFDTQESFDVFNQNVFSLSANLGNVDNYLQPTSGFLIRPRVEMGGVLVQLKDDVDYYKVQSEFVGYLPLGEDYTLSGRLYVGNIWPIKESRSQVADPQIEFRFDRIRYYAGGANDVRGWPSDLLGPKVPAVKRDTAGTITEYAVEPWGGLGKIAANIELRTPVPWLGSSWKGAVFLDMAELLPSDAAEERIRRIPLNEFRFGTGVGLRYQTMVGFIRLDLGYKVNPSIQDLASPREIFELREGLIGPSDVDTNIWDRLRLHLSIGQSF